VVEELLPAFVAWLAKVDADKGVVFRLDGFLDESHAGLPGGSASFGDVAFHTGTNYIFPG